MWKRFAAGQNLSGRGIKSPIGKAQLSKIPKRTLVNLIKLYRFLISSWTAPNCRFIPSCSTYAIEAIEKHGLIFGLGLSIRRIVRCNPWGAYGFDPVPDKLTWSKSKGGGSC